MIKKSLTEEPSTTRISFYKEKLWAFDLQQRGDPNSAGVVRLRGISTVGANVQPLVVVDGIIGASLDNVDPADIETINVLKDGSAAAIYGSRGSAGVILVTTKRGAEGKAQFEYKVSLRCQLLPIPLTS